MATFDVFNGDADGICSLLQLRQVDPRQSVKVTGVKRDIALLDRVEAGAGDGITVLDISLDKNRVALLRLLEQGTHVLYVDHHHPGEIPEHPGLQAVINTASDVTTSALVNGHLQGARCGWAVVGCFGDNLDGTAQVLAKTLDHPVKLERWRSLGIMLNYNGYGATVEDLHFHPEALFQRLLPFSDPEIALNEDPELLSVLEAAYASDMTQAEQAASIAENAHYSVRVLPSEPWARRVSGVFGNALANSAPDRAHAVLTEIEDGYLVSIRAPLNNRVGADEVCRQFDTGGGRAAAAGINCLPTSELSRFVDALAARYV